MVAVGIITYPTYKEDVATLGRSWINKRHLQWMKENQITVVPIPYYTTDYAQYMSQINGLLLTSSYLGSNPNDADEYTMFRCVKKFIQLAIQENDRGNPFPIFGVCMGFQQLVMAIANNRYLLTTFDANEYKQPLQMLDQGRLPPLQLANKSHKHYQGVSLDEFKKSKRLTDFFDVLSVDTDREGKTFVSTVQAKKYPFYGFQWHPEDAAKSSRIYGRFFAKELGDKGRTTHGKTRKLRYKDHRCSRHTRCVYKECRFFL
jgi:gamma-glutamyl hydrolase